VSTLLANTSCVAIAGPQGQRAVLIEGPPGSGKSSLALALIDRGAVLVGDDGVLLEERERRLWALPPPNIAGLIEVRNVGLATLPTCSAPLALVIRLDEAAERFIEAAKPVERAGHLLPAVALYPASNALPLRAEFALKMHGLA
jgi:serine kinase of HPr protein (carbohydrate metabolism regulator)